MAMLHRVADPTKRRCGASSEAAVAAERRSSLSHLMNCVVWTEQDAQARRAGPCVGHARRHVAIQAGARALAHSDGAPASHHPFGVWRKEASAGLGQLGQGSQSLILRLDTRGGEAHQRRRTSRPKAYPWEGSAHAARKCGA